MERYFDFNPVGKTKVKGKEKPQDIFELVKASEVVTRLDESVAKGLTRFVGRRNSMAALMEPYDWQNQDLGRLSVLWVKQELENPGLYLNLETGCQKTNLNTLKVNACNTVVQYYINRYWIF